MLGRRSLLQAEILIQLERKNAMTVTELSDRMNASRPSVSRSLKGLSERGFICYMDNEWKLTDTGVVEYINSGITLVDRYEKFMRGADEINKLWKRVHGS